MSIRIAVLGATGYSAKELLRLAVRHPDVEITALSTRQESAPHVADVHPALRGQLDLNLANFTPAEIASRADCVFSCLPHAASAEAVLALLDQGVRTIDLSADFRLKDPLAYKTWYEREHPDPQRLPEAAYGLPELYREAIRSADLVANPGCYPTAAILALAPLLAADAIDAEGIIIDSKSGVSGAGRTPKPHLHFPECNEDIGPYGVGRHRHTPEIDQTLTDAAGKRVEVVFTPHLIPMDRGILTTAYAQPHGAPSEEGIMDILRERYRDEPFVRVVEQLPHTKQVVGANYCDISARVVRGRVIVFSAIDNLIKGASGAALQNFNLMFGFDEKTAL